MQIEKKKIDSKILESKTKDLERLSAAGNVKETASLTLIIAQVLNDPASSDEVLYIHCKAPSEENSSFLSRLSAFPFSCHVFLYHDFKPASFATACVGDVGKIIR